jgi:hypothetical protein
MHVYGLTWCDWVIIPVAATLRCREEIIHQTTLGGQSEPDVGRRQLSDHTTHTQISISHITSFSITLTLASAFVYANGSDKHSKIRNAMIAPLCNSR